MFENIGSFFRKMVKPEQKELGSKDAAKERLHLVLMQDRANVSADFLELMKQEIIDVIKKYIIIDESAIDVRLTNQPNDDGTNGAPALYANIPIVNIKNEMIVDKVKEFEEDDSDVQGTEEYIVKVIKESPEEKKTEKKVKVIEKIDKIEDKIEDKLENIKEKIESKIDKAVNVDVFDEEENEESDDDDVTFDDLLKAAEEEDRKNEKKENNENVQDNFEKIDEIIDEEPKRENMNKRKVKKNK